MFYLVDTTNSLSYSQVKLENTDVEMFHTHVLESCVWTGARS
ncbi:hypothetical protein Sbal183_1945 [Shewanella baltica OS183]|jgi:hypothetical protein|nr:hypothetical protein Sbal183_1945 [Shewanella baltica OS183]